MRFSRQSKDAAQMFSYQSQVTTYQRHFKHSNRHAVMFMETTPIRLRSTGYVRNEKCVQNNGWETSQEDTMQNTLGQTARMEVA